MTNFDNGSQIAREELKVEDDNLKNALPNKNFQVYCAKTKLIPDEGKERNEDYFSEREMLLSDTTSSKDSEYDKTEEL